MYRINVSPFSDRQYVRWYGVRKWQKIVVGEKKGPVYMRPVYTWLFISPSGISELDCATTKTDTAERSISIGRESLQVFFVLGALAYFQVPPLRGSRE